MLSFQQDIYITPLGVREIHFWEWGRECMSWMIDRRDVKCCLLGMTCLFNLKLIASGATYNGPEQN